MQLNSKEDMKAIDVTTEKAERVALRFQDETGSVLRLVPRERDYALYENENLLAIFLYRKGAANIAQLLAQGRKGDFGIHTEMFVDGIMHLHKAGKVTNRKGLHDGFSVAIAIGCRRIEQGDA